jgi:hypothetical protein
LTTWGTREEIDRSTVGVVPLAEMGRRYKSHGWGISSRDRYRGGPELAVGAGSKEEQYSRGEDRDRCQPKGQLAAGSTGHGRQRQGVEVDMEAG